MKKLPGSLTLDLDGIDIGESFKISSVKLDSEVTPTIQGRDFVIATLAAPTVMKEPEKPAEAEAAEEKKVQKEQKQQRQRMVINQQQMQLKVNKKEGRKKKKPSRKRNLLERKKIINQN